MGIVIKEFDGSLVTPKDAAVMNELIFQSYGIFNGCNISFLGVNKIMIASGRMIVKGRQVVITEETIAAQLSSGGTKRGRLYMKIDLSNLDNPGTFLTQVADELPELTQQDDVNYSNGIFEVELCNYDVSETAISNIVETCPMITGSVDLLKSIEEVLANTEEGKAVDALVIKELTNSLGEDVNGMTIHEKLDYIMEMNLNVELSNVKALSQSTVISGLEVGKKYIAFLTNVNGYDVKGFNLNNCVIHQQTSVVISSSNNSRCAFMQGFIFTANSENINVNILVDGNSGAKDCGIICFEV